MIVMTGSGGEQFTSWDREKYRPQANHDRLSSFRLALSGLRYMLRYERSIRLLSAYTLIVVMLALWVQVSALALVMLLLAIGMVWVTECLNTAIEATVDLAMPQLHPLAKIAKDVSGTATFLSSTFSLFVSVVVLLPPLLQTLNG
jgi:undecaprenol kinase/diacylglycerol kinase (ATP)